MRHGVMIERPARSLKIKPPDSAKRGMKALDESRRKTVRRAGLILLLTEKLAPHRRNRTSTGKSIS
jgi:hypothetical protein